MDSIPYFATTPPGGDPNSIYHDTTINITQPLQLSNTAIQNGSLLCFGDCDAAATVNIFGGTPPFYIAFDGGTSTVLAAFDSTYINLCSGTYPISVTDANSCTVSSGSPISITINDPPPLSPIGFISSDYNGQDISCFGASDGEITGDVTGGTSPYTYSLDGITYGNTSVYANLSAGTYTIYYKYLT